MALLHHDILLTTSIAGASLGTYFEVSLVALTCDLAIAYCLLHLRKNRPRQAQSPHLVVCLAYFTSSALATVLALLTIRDWRSKPSWTLLHAMIQCSVTFVAVPWYLLYMGSAVYDTCK